MYPLTEDSNLPKGLLPIANHPMIYYSLQWLEKANINDVLIAVYPDAKNKISAYVHEVYETSLKIQVVEVPENCGSAEALRVLKPLIKLDFIVFSCDLITDVPPNVLINSFRVQNRTMCALLYDSGSLETGDRKKEDVEFIGIHDKTSTLLFMEAKADIGDDDLDIRSSLINKFQAVHIHSQLRDAHLYLFKRWVLELVAKNRSIASIKTDLVPLLLEAQHRKLVYNREGIDALQDEHNQDIFAKARLLSLSGNRSPSKVSCTAVCHLHGFTARANTVWSYSEINRTLAKNTPSTVPQATEISTKTQVGSDSLIGESTRIDERCSVKRSARIAKSATQSSWIIVKLDSCVVCQSAKILSKAELKDCEISGKYVVERETRAKGEHLVKNIDE
ncbi:hypothetical protein HDV06_004784 [Boothiomyces sp. JEL0866]|nr:hypothetical protein HDV06_004784 [Boothiomyces sp. JEL0866]